MAVCGASNNYVDCENNDCFEIVRSDKTITVPCTRNVREAYTVNVPHQRAYTVTNQVPYTDYEERTKQVPYQYMDRQTVTKSVPTCRVVPVTRNVCTQVPVRRRMPILSFFPGRRRSVVKKCPQTTYVRQRGCEPRQFCQAVQKTGWKNVTEQVPVQKVRNQPVTQYVTTNVPEKRFRWKQKTNYVKKTVPVYNIVPKTPSPCGPSRIIHQEPSGENYDEDFIRIDNNRDGRQAGHYQGTGAYDNYGQGNVAADFNRIDKDRDGKLNYQEVEFDVADANKDGELTFNEYAAARKSGNLQATADVSHGYGAQQARATASLSHGYDTQQAGASGLSYGYGTQQVGSMQATDMSQGYGAQHAGIMQAAGPSQGYGAQATHGYSYGAGARGYNVDGQVR